MQNEAGDTPLHTMVNQPQYGWIGQKVYRDIIPHFLRHGVNVDAQNQAGNTPLHIIVEQISKAASRWTGEMSEFMLKSLIDHGARISIQNNAGNTPLDILTRHSYSIEKNTLVEKID